MIREEFLHYLWQSQLFNAPLFTCTGKPLSVLSPGVSNKDSGPDFLNAKIKIGDMIWAGNVEIHTLSSMWHQHNHDTDPAYDNVILHVVYYNDRLVSRTSGERIETLECAGFIDNSLLQRYDALMQSRLWIPCARLFRDCSPLIRQSWYDYLLAERLEQKASGIEEALVRVDNDWEELTYHMLAKALGYRVNTTGFEMLARSVPLKILSKHRDNRFQLEALLFGQSGLLENAPQDEYVQGLLSEFRFLQKKYSLSPIPASVWKFMRLRPVAFPTIRISILAGWIEGNVSLFNRISGSDDLNTVMNDFFDKPASGYWDTRYTFGHTSGKDTPKRLGEDSKHSLLINSVFPLLFLYGRKFKVEKYCHRVLDYLEQQPPEDNAVIRKWVEIGAEVNSAATTQALLQLQKYYCQSKKCLQCRIGAEILRAGKTDS